MSHDRRPLSLELRHLRARREVPSGCRSSHYSTRLDVRDVNHLSTCVVRRAGFLLLDSLHDRPDWLNVVTYKMRSFGEFRPRSDQRCLLCFEIVRSAWRMGRGSMAVVGTTEMDAPAQGGTARWALLVFVVVLVG